jgi:hypothetical protein
MGFDITSNVTRDNSGNASVDAIQAQVQESTTALFVALVHAGHTGQLADAVLLASLGMLFLGCLCWRPRLTGAVGISWLAWFAFRFAKGQAAWHEIADHAQHARKSTESGVVAVAEMFASWCVLLAPALLDLHDLLAPLVVCLAHGMNELWEQLSWPERGIIALSALAVASSVMAVKALVRHQDTICDVLFQLSFALCGPLIWWLTSRLPQVYSVLLVSVVMSFVPSLASLRVVLAARSEKDALHRKPTSDSRTAWFALDAVEDPLQESISDELQDKMHMWLSYWACWPSFYFSYKLVGAAGFVPKDDKAAVDGLFVALILWSQLWRASRVAPYAFAICAALLRNISEGAAQMANDTGNKALGKFGHVYAMLSENASNSWVVYAGGALVIIIATAVLLKVVELAEAFVTLVFLFGSDSILHAASPGKCLTCTPPALPSGSSPQLG